MPACCDIGPSTQHSITYERFSHRRRAEHLVLPKHSAEENGGYTIPWKSKMKTDGTQLYQKLQKVLLRHSQYSCIRHGCISFRKPYPVAESQSTEMKLHTRYTLTHQLVALEDHGSPWNAQRRFQREVGRAPVPRWLPACPVLGCR